MPISHLGLPISHIPSATSFYLAALQPLGYRYFGNWQDSVGLGIHRPDFFLCHEPRVVTPTHLAFSADHRNVVRDCYAAALKAGALPSGAPAYQAADCISFNAAVVDLDGHTVEFIWRKPGSSDGLVCPSHSQSLQEDVYRGDDDCAESVASTSLRRSHTRSRAHTALDLASTRPTPPRKPGLSRSRTEPTSSQALFGTVLAAAAGAALAYAMCKSELDNAREEARFAAAVPSRGRRDDPHNSSGRRTASAATSFRKIHRYHGDVESRASRYPPSLPPSFPPTIIRAIDSQPYYKADSVQHASGRHSSTRPPPARSKTYTEVECTLPQTTSSRYTAIMFPIEDNNAPQLFLEGPKDTASRHRSGRDTTETSRSHRHNSVVSLGSSRVHRDPAGSRRSPRPESILYDTVAAAAVPVPPSIVPSRAASRARPSAPRPPPHASSRPPRLASYPPIYALAPRVADASSPRPSHILDLTNPLSGPHMGADGVYQRNDHEDGCEDGGDHSDGLSDARTIVPDDSISCIDLPCRSAVSRSRGRERDHGGSRHGFRREEDERELRRRGGEARGEERGEARGEERGEARGAERRGGGEREIGIATVMRRMGGGESVVASSLRRERDRDVRKRDFAGYD